MLTLSVHLFFVAFVVELELDNAIGTSFFVSDDEKLENPLSYTTNSFSNETMNIKQHPPWPPYCNGPGTFSQ